jgi:hypothetical protein
MSAISNSNLTTRAILTHHGPAYETRLNSHFIIRVVPHWLHQEFHQSGIAADLAQGSCFVLSHSQDKDTTKISISPTRAFSRSDIHRDSMWKIRKELGAVLARFSLPDETPIRDVLIWAADKLLRSRLSDHDRDVLDDFFVNSQALFEKLISKYHSGRSSYDPAKYSQLGASETDYSHISHFAWLYWRQIQEIHAICKDRPNSANPITVVDLATGGASFILSAIHYFQTFVPQTPLILFVGIDKNCVDMAIGEKMCAKALKPGGPIQLRFQNDDVISPGFADRLIALKADLVVANHVLEHLPGFSETDPQLENCYIHNWLLAARHSLSISVPFEQRLESAICAHRHAFTRERLLKLGRDMEIRSGQAVEAKDMELTTLGGLLTLEKVPSLKKHGGFSGATFSVDPKHLQDIVPSAIDHDFLESFNPAKFQLSRKSPKIGDIQDKSRFSSNGHPGQIRQLPIKFPHSRVMIPVEFHQCEEAIQIIFDHNKSINPHYDEHYAYLNIFRGLTKHDAYRGLSLSNHGDQLQGLNPKYWYNPDYSYIVSSTLATTFYNQPFDVGEAVKKFESGVRVNLYDYLNAQGSPERIYKSDNYGIYLLSPYIVHAASLATTVEFRVFLKIAFSTKRFFDNRELRRNPAFAYDDWYGQETVGFLDEWLQHAHFNERYLKSDIVSENGSLVLDC